MPFGPFRFQDVEGFGRTVHAGTADCEFGHHDRQPEDGQKDEVEQNEGRAAVFARYEWKAPYVAETDGTARRYEDEAQTG